MNRRALNPDYLLLIITYMLVAIGIFMVFDSSYARAGETARLGHDSFYYVKRQAIAAGLGLIVMQWIIRVPYWKIRRLAVLFLGVSIVLLALVWFPGIRVVFAGAHRWIKLPLLGNLQCSEVAKLALILYLAHVGSATRNRIRSWSGLLPRLGVIGLIAAMVVKEPDMGTAMVIVGIGFCLLMASGARVAHLGTLLAIVGGLAVPAIMMKGYRLSRLMAFLNPWKYYNKSGYQIIHSLVALGSGGVFGRGLAQGVQKFFYLPAGHTDFIFATVGEELGLVGTLGILLLFFIFVYRGMAIAHKTKDPFGMLLAVGISTMVGIQALLNIAVVTSSVPATGVPLPFISFGGSSLILMMVSAGVLVNISKYPDPIDSAGGERARDESPVVGGGTGGHIYPALSTAEALRECADALLFLGSETGPEGRIVRDAGWEFVGLPAAPLRRSARGLAAAAAGAGSGGVKALNVIRRFRPDVVVVTGGYAGLAAGLAAGFLKIPLVLEEPNAVPGRVTRILAPMARLITTALPGPERRLPAGKALCTGFPIRSGITEGSASAARNRWDLPLSRPMVLLYGGSQGALTLNRAAEAAIERWSDAGFNVLHGTGRKLFDEAEARAARSRYPGYRPVPYIDGMADAYAAADLVVCRGGASSIAEATACGKPMVIVPYPHHADRHQVENGRVVEAAGAGIVVENRDAVAALPGLVVSLMRDPEKRRRMADASRRMGRTDAAEKIADHVRTIGGGRTGGGKD